MKLFRKLIYCIAGLFCITSQAFGQSHTNHVNVGVGCLYERGMDATVSVEHETKYHNAWEYFATGYVKWDDCESCAHVCPESFWKNYRSWALGVAYKPCVIRGKNNHGNLRLGASFGSDTNDFIYIINLGYQHTYALYNGVNLFWQVKTDIVPEGKDVFRTGAVIGIGIPIN